MITKMTSILYLSGQIFSSTTSTYGCTFGEWLQNQRLVLNQRLLETTKLSVPQVAEQAGFGSDSVFRKHFKSAFHVSPIQWRTTFKQ